jgi:hypothetical protein
MGCLLLNGPRLLIFPFTQRGREEHEVQAIMDDGAGEI